MKTPFPGMDPWLEHPAIWADVHNSLIVAISDDLTSNLVPEFVARLGQRVFILRETDPICPKREKVGFAHLDQLKEIYLEIRDVKTRSVVTVIEVLSPANKVDMEGRRQYIQKRRNVLSTLTSFVEIDLLRAGEPMDQPPQRPATDYRILVSRGFERYRSHLYFFGIRQTIPSIPIPLLPGMEEPLLDLNQLVHSLYTRARFDLSWITTNRRFRHWARKMRDGQRAWLRAVKARRRKLQPQAVPVLNAPS